MTPSELKYHVEQADPGTHFFTRFTMRFFGDTMKNFGVRQTEINGRKAWALYRKRPTAKTGRLTPYYFDAETFKRMHIERT